MEFVQTFTAFDFSQSIGRDSNLYTKRTFQPVENFTKSSLFNEYEGERFNKISSLMDKFNRHYGAGALRLSSERHNPKWNLRMDFLSPNYTTD